LVKRSMLSVGHVTSLYMKKESPITKLHKVINDNTRNNPAQRP
jgi:hypothetical protein